MTETVTCFKDLPELNNIIQDIQAPPQDKFYNTDDCNDLKETICIFIEDFIINNVDTIVLIVYSIFFLRLQYSINNYQ